MNPDPRRTPGRSGRRSAAIWLTCGLLLGSCAPSPVVATVNGVTIDRTELAALHPNGVPEDPDEAAASTFLLVLHSLLIRAAEEQFAIVITDAERQSAFEVRTAGLGTELEDQLADRDVTVERIKLDADLDVLRRLVQRELINVPGRVDEAKAYRDFLAVNASACLTVLTFIDDDAEATARTMAKAGETLEAIRSAVGDSAVGATLGCASPVQHGGDLAAVALDGEIGIAYPRTSDGIFYVAAVTEREEPAAEDHRAEILDLAADRQGDSLFDAWAVEVMQNAEVRIDPSIGTWTPSPDSGEVPVVVP